MPIARPDTSRRREPAGPGRRFGPCTPSSIEITRPRLTWRALVLALAWTLCLATNAAAEDDGPIVLNNEDVARLHAQPEGADAAEANAPSADDDDAREPVDAAELAALEKDLRSRLDRISRQSMGSVANALDTRLSDSSQQQLRARAARTTATRSAPAAPMPDAVDAQVTGPGRSAEAEDQEEDAPAYLAPTPACIYGTRNQLLFQPEGSSCPRVRARSQRTFASGESAARVSDASESGRVGCVYGSRGQLLYSSEGVDCPSSADDTD